MSLPIFSGDADRYDHREGNDDYSQPGALFRLLGAAQQERLFANIASSMQGVPAFIRRAGAPPRARPPHQ